MKKVSYLALVGVLVITGLLAAVSCKSSNATTPPGGAQTSPPPGGTTGPDFKPAAVEIKDFAYNPATITVAIGTTVTWTNKDSAPHSVTERERTFDSALLFTGATFSHTFNEAGDVEYYCTVHPTMVGHVIVK